MRFDLLLRGGHVIDPKNGIDAPKDVAVAAGKIAAVDDAIPPGQAARVLDVSGLFVVPGLVDIHVHLYATAGNRDAWAGDYSILPDGFSWRYLPGRPAPGLRAHAERRARGVGLEWPIGC